MILVDTNILARSAQPSHPMRQTALAAGDALKRQGEALCLVPQVIYEFWTLCTRPSELNGLGMSVTEARANLDHLLPLFTFLPDVPAIFGEWERLVVEKDVKGKSSHDARLVAAMHVHGIPCILTFNTPDFQRYSDIRVLDPRDVAGVSVS